MGGKNKYTRVRLDDDLKQALKESMEGTERNEHAQVRYLLRIALGMVRPEPQQRPHKPEIDTPANFPKRRHN